MSTFASETVDRVEILSRWFGFYPPAKVAKLVLTRDGDRFRRERLPEGGTDELTSEPVNELVHSLASPPVPQLDPTHFDIPVLLEDHYNSCWTNDNPAHMVRISFSTGRAVTIRTDRQYAFMLPFKVEDSTSGTNFETFDPRLSRAIAGLMPEGYLERDRLLGQNGMLNLDREEYLRREAAPEAAPEPPPPPDRGPEEQKNFDDPEAGMDEIFRVLWGEESPAEKARSEREGNLAERLLRRISTEDVRDLLARGADPNAADDVGQTALMHAAFPPFNVEKFRLLVEAGADVEALRNDGVTGLHNACAGWEVKAAEEWLRAGANVNARTPEGATPLMLAVGSGDIVRMLLAAGAEVNAVDRDGHSALVHAIFESHGRGWLMVPVLLQAGVKVDFKDREGLTPLDHARRVMNRIVLQEEFYTSFYPREIAPSKIAEEAAESVVRQIEAAIGGSPNAS
jgi:hypothetical protein